MNTFTADYSDPDSVPTMPMTEHLCYWKEMKRVKRQFGK